ncbi:hypothetical protein Dvar_39920 [Desulfosarcina variabilis str. Montpellier]|uniref:hypothetical protein n=1 Tax=Desulfosarcina variabilis TaxID=2300 RepID=UPI003AFB4061
MIHYFTNREIAEKLDINLARWKRWSRSFLPPDPLGGLQSGYARQYVFKDLFKVYLGGYLVSHLKLSVTDAQTVLADLSPWLKKKGFLELNGSVERVKENVGCEHPYQIFLRTVTVASGKKTSAFGYLIHKIIDLQPMAASSRHINQTVEETILGCDIPDGSTFLMAPDVYIINLSALFYDLIERLTITDQSNC